MIRFGNLQLDSTGKIAFGDLWGLGMLVENVPSTGADGPSPIYGIGVPGQEVRTEIRVLPVDGDLEFFPDSSFTFTTSSPETQTFTHQPYLGGPAFGSPVVVTLTTGSQTVNAALTQTLNDAVLSATGTIQGPPSSVTGSVNQTLNDATLSATATVGASVTGTVDLALNDAVLNAIAVSGEILPIPEVNPQLVLTAFPRVRCIDVKNYVSIVRNFTKKRTEEIESFSINFQRVLERDETITAANVSVQVVRGADTAPGNMLLGVPATTNGFVSQMIRNGVSGCTYALKFTITTSAGQTMSEIKLLPVDDSVLH